MREDVEQLLADLGAPRATVRWPAALAFTRIRDARAVEPLQQALGDPESVVRQAAAQALGHQGHEGAVPSLLIALGDARAWVRRAAADALVQIATARQVRPPSKHSSSPTSPPDLPPLASQVQAQLLERLTDETWTESWPDILHALGRLGDRQALEPLLNLVWKPDLVSSLDRWVRRPGGIISLPTAMQMMRHLVGLEIEIQVQAAEALGLLGDPQACPVLRTLSRPWKSTPRRVKEAAREALARIETRLEKTTGRELSPASPAPPNPPPGPRDLSPAPDPEELPSEKEDRALSISHVEVD